MTYTIKFTRRIDRHIEFFKGTIQLPERSQS